MEPHSLTLQIKIGIKPVKFARLAKSVEENGKTVRSIQELVILFNKYFPHSRKC